MNLYNEMQNFPVNEPWIGTYKLVRTIMKFQYTFNVWH